MVAIVLDGMLVGGGMASDKDKELGDKIDKLADLISNTHISHWVYIGRRISQKQKILHGYMEVNGDSTLENAQYFTKHPFPNSNIRSCFYICYQILTTSNSRLN